MWEGVCGREGRERGGSTTGVYSGNEYFDAYESCCSVHILISYLVEIFTASLNED